jgi:hypothetical protein
MAGRNVGGCQTARHVLVFALTSRHTPSITQASAFAAFFEKLD